MDQRQVFWRSPDADRVISCVACGDAVRVGAPTTHCGVAYTLLAEFNRGDRVRMDVRVKDGGQQ